MKDPDPGYTEARIRELERAYFKRAKQVEGLRKMIRYYSGDDIFDFFSVFIRKKNTKDR